jgi:hypothetical protein
VRLVGAELRRLRRPLTAVVAVAFVALVVALALDTAWSTDEQAVAAANRGADDLEGLVEPVGDQLAEAAARDLAVGAALRDPLAAGSFAAGHAASLPGALAVLVLSAAHVGGSVRRRTLAPVLLQQGRRARVLAARALSLWLVGAGLLAAAWAALALLAVGLRLAEAGWAPAGRPEPARALAVAGGRAAMALAVMAVFVLVGVLAGVVAGNGPAAFGSGLAALAAALGLAEVAPGLGRFNPANWVAAVMGFHDPTLMPDHLWVGLQAGAAPGSRAALAGLGIMAALAVATATGWFHRADVRV